MASKRNGAVAYATEASVRALASDMSALRSEVGQLDARVGQLDARVGQLDASVTRLDARIGDVETRLSDKINFVGAMVEQLVSDMRVYVEGTRGEVEALKRSWAEAQRQIELRIFDLEDVVRRRSRDLGALEKEVAKVRADLEAERASMNSVRDDLVKWKCDGGELPPIIARHDARFDALEQRLAAVEARLRE